MTPSRAIALLAGAGLMALTTLAGAGCGGSTASSRPHGNTNKPPPPSVEVSTNRLGRVLVDSNGRTLYLFKKDKGAKSACLGPCARAWPPLRAKSKPTAGGGAKASLVATTSRPDGPPQVTYNGHPLYLYEGDLKPGDATGQGLDVWGGVWWAVSPSGKEVTKGGKQPPGAGY